VSQRSMPLSRSVKILLPSGVNAQGRPRRRPALPSRNGFGASAGLVVGSAAIALSGTNVKTDMHRRTEVRKHSDRMACSLFLRGRLLHRDQAENLAVVSPGIEGFMAVLHDHLAFIENVHRAVGAEFDIDRALDQVAVALVDLGAGKIADVSDEIAGGMTIEIDAHDLKTHRPRQDNSAAGERRAVAAEGDDHAALEFLAKRAAA